MARSATTSDAFNAIAEPRRRDILNLLATGERPVNEMVHSLRLKQPQVSKHLRVLEKAGLLIREKEGRVHRFTTDLRRIQQAADWLDRYRNFWTAQFNALDKHLSKTRKD